MCLLKLTDLNPVPYCGVWNSCSLWSNLLNNSKAKLPSQGFSSYKVEVVILDKNDSPPEFKNIPPSYMVSEDLAPGQLIATITAEDPDTIGTLTYSIQNDEPTPFTLDSQTGELTLSDPLDRETTAAYQVTVRADDGMQYTDVTIIVQVTDTNDNPPVFKESAYSFDIPENAARGSVVGTVAAIDLDSGPNAQLTYTVISDWANDVFSLNPQTGIFTLTARLDYEEAHDNGRPSLSGTVTVYVNVIDLNDNAPIFDPMSFSNEIPEDIAIGSSVVTIQLKDVNDMAPEFVSPNVTSVSENIPLNTVVMTIKAIDKDEGRNGYVEYFMSPDPEINGYFSLGNVDGILRATGKLDRELRSSYTITVTAKDRGDPPNITRTKIFINILDENDNSPVFDPKQYSASVPENASIGASVLQVSATDIDEDINGRVRYAIASGDENRDFGISEDTGIVRVAKNLNFERKSRYILTIRAEDSAKDDVKFDTAEISISIQDINDNPPTFLDSPYLAYVMENVIPPNSGYIITVHAYDADSPPFNNQVRYFIKEGDADLFKINASSGQISLLRTLDREAQDEYTLSVVAMDTGSPPLTGSGTVKIVVQDVNDNSPEFERQSYKATLKENLPQDTPEGVLVTRLSATSPKKGPVGLLQYAVAGGNIGDALRVEPISGEVFITGKGLDYETMPLYEVWFEVRDSDSPPLKSFIEVEIKVTDANDNAPIIVNPLYNATVMEEESPPQLVIKIDAHDEDSNENGRISYKLVNDYEETFRIDPDTGEIFTNIALDRESIPFYEIPVEATDHGAPQLTGSSVVIVTVLDKNDNPPRFTRLFSVNVTENSDIGSFVIRVTSSDLDIGPNANATYSFVENPGEKFVIDTISGNVTVARPLDRELQDEYILKVAAIDGAWRSETPLTITIQDQNDNAPEFEYSYYSFNFPELQQKNSFVGQVIATDRDKQGPNSIISYSLQQTSDLFSIDPATGEILSKFVMNYKRTSINQSPENTYSVVVVATDNGKPPMSSECLVTINVVDANNNAPKFKSHEKFVPVPKEAKIGEKIIKVIAEDELDFGINAEIEYHVTGGNGTAFLTIGRTDGWIKVSKKFYYLGQYYELKVKAVDRGVPPQSDETKLTFVVTDENVYSPKFTALSYQVIVPENEPIGSPILTVKASDEDEGPNGIIRYSISPGNAGKEFHIHPISGVISILRSLDYDTIQEYRLNITAKDLGFKSKETTATLTIILTDINDNAPIFNQTQYIAYLPENSPVNSFIYKVKAVDIDSPKNAIIKYYIQNEMSSLFHIDVDSGEIFSKDIFDFEEKSMYKLQILAKNPDSTMQNTTEVIVYITGVNEYYPKFIQPVFHFDVSESAEVGTNVGDIQATDQDSGDDGIIYYLFVGSSNDKGFSINSQTGVIRVARYLDRETQNRVVLTVLAKNSGGIHGNDTDEAQVIISIQDGNDPPEFLRHLYEATISEGARIGQEVIQVKAVDKDVRPQNNQFSYSIIGGNINQEFKIDPQSGEIEVSRYLDRETIPMYSLIVGAIDTGIPPQTGTTTVKITLTDINDNGPLFDNASFEGAVYENEPPNTSITTLTAKDPDLPPNGAPFSYFIVGGKHQNYVKVNRHTGILLTTKKIDREVTPNLEIIVQIEDSGNPVMKSNYTLMIKVLDRNDNPPTPRSAHILVYAFNNKVTNGKIANVKPNDADIVGDYRCKIIKESTSESTLSMLSIKNGCDLYTTAVKPGQGYTFSVLGNDGIHRDVISSLSIEYFSFDNNGGPAMLNAPNLIAGTNDSLMGRNLHSNETSLNSYMSDNADIMRNVGHIVGPELLSKKYKDREIMNIDPPRPQRPDIIEREVVGKSPALREDHHPPPPPSTNTSHHTHDHPSGIDLNSEVPEHYDLENASSIAPSDIDIVYHYKGFREAAGVRKYKATPPPIAGYHHKHQTPQHRHSPHHTSGYPSRVLPQASQPLAQPRQHQTTPLARLSPSSELSQQPRILTLHDISGKPLQSALLATTSSSGGVGKDALHSNSERSLNSPVMSQLSGQSSSAGRKTPSVPPQVPQVVSVGSGAVGLTSEEIERMNARQRTSSLVSTLDAVSSSSEAPRGGGVGHHMSHRHHSPQDDNRSSSGSDDESGNDSFTCSEIEYDNNSISADKPEDGRRQNLSSNSNSKKPIVPPPYESFESSFRGSLSTLVASDDDLAPHVGSALYRQANGSPASATLGWDYLANWGPNFESMIGVFKDIAELPDSVNGRISSTLRLPNGTPKPSEEYV
ncbi:unnamed protein product [Chilo suppressalis]|uniref:Cadherin domain-containing protein n=1 Tax=Chilo suppressalis TaxID=168631 RepID=A0ABN8BAU6_CHISP|nr:unnamed protein product [Chilo suppressalis]